MKKILIILFCLVSIVSYGQITPSSSTGTLSNKPYFMVQAGNADFRAQYYDGTNFIFRDYQSVSEANTYLNLAKYRGGHFLVYIHNGGVLNPNGTYTGGTTDIYTYLNGVADGDLVLLQSNAVTASQGVSISGSNVTLGGIISGGGRTLEVASSGQLNIRTSSSSPGGIIKLSSMSPSTSDSAYISLSGLNPSPAFALTTIKASGASSIINFNSATLTNPYISLTSSNAGSTLIGQIRARHDSLVFSQTNGIYKFENLTTSADSTTYKPAMFNAAGQLVKGTAWFGGGGSGISGLTATRITFALNSTTLTDAATLTFASGSGVMTVPSIALTAATTTRAPLNIGGYGSLPTSPVTGMMAFRSSDSSIQIYTGANWIPYKWTKDLVVDGSGGSLIPGTGSFPQTDTLRLTGGGSASLTAQRVGYGNGSNILDATGEAAFSYAPSTNKLSVDTVMQTRIHYVPYNGNYLMLHNQQADTIPIGSKPYGMYSEWINGGYRNEDGQIDYVRGWGYNTVDNGVRRNTNEAAMWWAQESHYISGGDPQFEYYGQFISKNGLKNYRFGATNINKVTGAKLNYETTDDYQVFSTTDAVNPYFLYSQAAVTFAQKADGQIFRITRATRYFNFDIDSTNNYAQMTTDQPGGVRINGATVYINGVFRTVDALGGQDNQQGSTTFASGSAPTFKYFKAGSATPFQKVYDITFGGEEMNTAVVTGTNDPAFSGFGWVWHKDAGVTEQLRGFSRAPGGAATLAISFNNAAGIGIGVGVNGLTERLQIKGKGTTTNVNTLWTNSAGTTIASILDNGLTSLPLMTTQVLDSTNYKIVVRNQSTGALYYMAWPTFAPPGSGITSLNGLTGATQTFATPGTTGTAPNWVSSGTAHTLHIPLMDNAGVTAGLLSNAAQDIPGVKNFISAPIGGASVTGQSFEVRSFGVSSAAGTATLKFGPAGAATYGIGFNAGADYFQMGGNSAALFGRVSSTEGSAIFLDYRGITATIRFETTTTGGTATYTSVGADGNWAIGTSTQSPTAWMQIAAGTTTNPPLKLTSGTSLTTPEAGSMEFDGSHFYLSPSTTRKKIPLFTNATVSTGALLVGNGADFNLTAIGTTNQVLTVIGGTAVWTTPSWLSSSEGTYTPTITAVTNITGSPSSTVCNYAVIGTNIYVWGQITLDPTATGAWEVGISFPSGFAYSAANNYACVGTAGSAALNEVMTIFGDDTNDRAALKGVAVDVASRTVNFSFRSTFTLP